MTRRYGRPLDSISPREFEAMEEAHEARELYAYLSAQEEPDDDDRPNPWGAL